MFAKVISFFLAFLFLTGSIIFPLGDFSLVSDIPAMYHNYTQITSDDEMGAIDFIGDYLLHGKDIFGHNEHDKTPAKGAEVQFQHQASPPTVILNQISLRVFVATELTVSHPVFHTGFYTIHYQNKLFRPPLAKIYLS